MLESTETAPIPAAVETQAADAPLEDTRAPVGMDAGAPQVTAAEADEGGWHGDAEADAGSPAGEEDKKGDGRPEKAPIGAKVEQAPELVLDAEAKKLAQEAMKAVEGI